MYYFLVFISFLVWFGDAHARNNLYCDKIQLCSQPTTQYKIITQIDRMKTTLPPSITIHCNVIMNKHYAMRQNNIVRETGEQTQIRIKKEESDEGDIAKVG